MGDPRAWGRTTELQNVRFALRHTMHLLSSSRPSRCSSLLWNRWDWFQTDGVVPGLWNTSSTCVGTMWANGYWVYLLSDKLFCRNWRIWMQIECSDNTDDNRRSVHRERDKDSTLRANPDPCSSIRPSSAPHTKFFHSHTLNHAQSKPGVTSVYWPPSLFSSGHICKTRVSQIKVNK